MYKLYYFFLASFFSLFLLSCNGSDDSYSACFGGEVQNPKTRYVLFSRGNKVIDTLPLDKNNRFFIKFDSLTPGLYSFKHEPEYQYVYFDKNDSLMVSINANDFDGSVVFSGKGEEKNNFMMELFLAQEKDRATGTLTYDKGYAAFMKTIDSAYNLRKNFYTKSKEAINWSDGFDVYAKARVDLNYYTKKEYYPYVHERRTGRSIRAQLPKDYYSFRKKIQLNEGNLTGFSPFVRYYTAMLNNMSVDGVKDASISAENALRDNIVKLAIADTLFTNDATRNQVLDNIAFSYLLEDRNIQHNKQFLEKYLELSTDKNEANEIHKMGRAIAKLNPGSRLPQIPLKDASNKIVTIGGGKNETIIFFWTTVSKSHFEDMYRKANALKRANPALKFIAVNVDSDEQWKKVMQHYTFPIATQLRAADFKSLRENWVFTKIDRTIVLNADGTIKNAFANLLDNDFEKELK